jgi:cytochrome c peroxidase
MPIRRPNPTWLATVSLLSAMTAFGWHVAPSDAGGLERQQRERAARAARHAASIEATLKRLERHDPAAPIHVVRHPAYLAELDRIVRAVAMASEREIAGAAAREGYPRKPASTVDPRIEPLLEGARRAWQTLEQPPRRLTPPVPPPPAATAPPRPTPPSPEAVRPPPPSAEPALGLPLEALQRLFRRPPEVMLQSRRDARAELGLRLFSEPKLSADHKMSCATCHDPAKSFQDDRARAKSNKGEALARNTPSVWNVGFGKSFYWDGRAASLEAQVKDAIEREGEMDATLDAAVLWLAKDRGYSEAFARTFGAAEGISPRTLTDALAAYQRSLISPETRFDRWIEGDATALDATELAGFRLFTGKGRCLTCHGGWRFTDDSFHDTGLRSTDRGRAALPGVASAERAFKTPSLREVRWSAPYMHDGSLKSLEDVVAHYAGRLEPRASLAAELKRGIALNPQERAQLVAFLKAISSDQRPRAP